MTDQEHFYFSHCFEYSKKMKIHISAVVRQRLQMAIKVDFLNIMMKAKYVKNIYFTFWWVSYEHRWNMKFFKAYFSAVNIEIISNADRAFL